MIFDYPFINKDNISVSTKIGSILDLISNQNYIICFDCEFQSYLLNNEDYIGETISIGDKPYNIKSFVLETGGVIFEKKNNKWFITGHFMFNNPVLIEEDREIFNYQTVRLLIPDYLNTNDKTMKKISKYFNNIIKSVDDKKFMNSFDRKSETKYRLFGSFFRNRDNFLSNYDNKKMFEYHVNIIQDYINDTKERTYDLNLITQFYMDIFRYSTIIVKGNRDIESIKNVITFTNIKYKTEHYVRYINKVDIESFNNIFRYKTGTAKLEDNFRSIKKLGDKLINKFIIELEKIHSMQKAHNPLVDALFTVIVCIYIFKFIKIKELKGGYQIEYS